ncbi:metal-dependent hydrolase [Helicobacter sp. 13S00477-4]|uniref:aminofutalosine deaminase family hydrolase n=1 Tax=Helicobacter sp. 13S00477-4 TaxID=1905759 RepID=UPI000BA6F0ED|nr:metal-dependent hydrolase [Helicobacter sp. 13S00477-4]PAF52265.1 hypothetical protein BKH44_02855 [Helicobacter sp. 13S00477-4]
MTNHIKLIGASKVFICNEAFDIISNGGVAFECFEDKESKIIEVGDYQTLKKKYPNASFYDDSVILPAFINTHIHFEFGNNISSFIYGSFEKWLESVMQKRDEVLNDIQSSVKSSIQEQLQSGVATVGAISSYGQDMPILANSDLRVIYFSEVIGSIPVALDFLYESFSSRYIASKGFKSHKFTPAIALHSPYSVHSILAKKVLEIAKKDNCLLSTHFLESAAEREWLEDQKGWFKTFYKNTLKIPSPKPLYTIKEFLDLFEGMRVLFTHCLFATHKELLTISKNGYVISCPRSNRLLNNTYIDLSMLKSAGLNPIFATDGKSSNDNLNMLDELKCALFSYPNIQLEDLSKTLILGATKYAAKALNLKSGALESDKFADISIFECPQIAKSSQPSLQFLLQCKKVKTLYINGNAVIQNQIQ